MAMKETPQQYTKRILGYLDGRKPLEVQRTTADKIARVIRPLSGQQLRKPPTPGQWSIAEIIAHLAEAELVHGYRVRMILGSNGTSIQAFDQNVWARNSKYASQDPRDSLKLFRILRESNLKLLRSLPRNRWSYYGMHAERGKETIAHLAKMFAGHDINHIQQIERIAKSAKRAK